MASPPRLTRSSAETPTDAQQPTTPSGSSSQRRSSWRSLLPPLREQRSSGSRNPPPVHAASGTASASSPVSERRARAAAAATVTTSAQPASDRSRRRVTPTAPVNPGLADTWGSDSLDDFSLVTQVGNLDDTNEDGQYLSAFADVDFSSPSSYPSFVNPPADDDPLARQAPSQPQQAAAAYPGSAAPLRRASACGRTMAAPSRSTTQLTASSVGESQNSLFNDILDEPLTSQSTQSSVADMPAPGTMHGLLNEEPEPGRFAKRRRMPGVASGNSTGVKDLVLPLVSDDDDLFGENENPPPDTDDFATIDLTKATEVPEELKKPEVDNRVKLSAFQCVICMDDVTTLTLTHCGHLFCQQCLHSSLHVDATRGKCPMCRAKIDMKPRASYNTKTKGFWPLELKLMTKSKQGKRKADDMA